MAGRPIALTPHVACAAALCPMKGARGTERAGGRPQPPVGWHEIVVPNDDGRTQTILFACSMRCKAHVMAGIVKNPRPMSDKKPMPGQ